MDFQDKPVVITRIDDGFRVATIGSIHTNTEWLEHEFKKVADAKPKLVELDLSKTDYVSSWGLGVLMSLRNGVAKSGGTLRITAIQKEVLNALRYACLHQVFQVSPGVVVEKGA
jgi:anti-anti-sigma factor